ncbi:response regulator [Microbacterium azadirachtae]|jgi:DNA-binding NarL/FixJ family response regulator|uniref:DNA-binding response regulator, NarL/FixJ family, contains REC and HTH domains n=1 Tax=Microbacterium azadirachtae TaxID=582680 RepID=A0A1I6HJX9_9MICO|nr:response regulator transcription factor [Microbacterium azadirachtae]SFR54765.1 DNA-binding response regulator, NarL/FixJ family, contains REC and HTH domains [Microbacterium azadirachtae]
MTTVLIVDDQAMLRAGFSAILQAQDGIDVIGQAADGAEGVDEARRLRPDVVLMDVRMPNLDGIEATRRILAAAERDGRPAPAVLVLTTFDADEYVHEALRAGASGFLLKDALPEELVQAVRVVASGDALLAPRITRRLLERFAESRPRTGGTELRLKGLTEREHEILVLIGRGLSNREIASSLFLAEQTVKTHVSRVFAKLGLRDRVQAVILAYDAGLVAPAG